MISTRIIIAGLALLAAPAIATTYPSMAPVAQYMIPDRAAEVALARSAAPASISAKATVLVLGRHSYETAATGSNGFTCLVERAWTSAFDDKEFWNPRARGPICYNAAAVRSVLPYIIRRTELAMAGASKEDMLKNIQAAVAKKTLPWPEAGAMSYMMSKQQYLNDVGRAWHPHLMFHIPKVAAASWGANESGSPIMQDSAHVQMPEPETTFMVAAGHWSDGTPDMPMHH